jgi:hypothetical protein
MQQACAKLGANVARMRDELLVLNSDCIEEIAHELQKTTFEQD